MKWYIIDDRTCSSDGAHSNFAIINPLFVHSGCRKPKPESDVFYRQLPPIVKHAGPKIYGKTLADMNKVG
jgi:hypothetical protein